MTLRIAALILCLLPSAAVAGDVPELPGEVRCFSGESTINGKHSANVLIRQGITDGKMVEDSVAITGGGTYRYKTVFETKGKKFEFATTDGSNLNFAGTGKFKPGWTAWKSKAVGQFILAKQKAKLSDGKLKIMTASGASAETVALTVIKATALDAAACAERFSEIDVPDGLFP